MTEHSDQEIFQAWANIVGFEQRVVQQIEDAFKREELPSLGWYDILLELSRHAPGGMRQNMLEKALLLRQYNLSRLIDRMQVAGLVTRQPCAQDKRGHEILITDLGQQTRRNMWPIYRDIVRDQLGDKLDPSEIDTMRALFQKLKKPAEH